MVKEKVFTDALVLLTRREQTVGPRAKPSLALVFIKFFENTSIVFTYYLWLSCHNHRAEELQQRLSKPKIFTGPSRMFADPCF